AAGVQRLGQRCFDLISTDSHWLLGIALALALAVILQAGTSRNQTTDHHVFLQAAQVIALAGNRRLGKNAGGFLEGCRRDERLGGQRRLGNTQQYTNVLGDELVLRSQALVLFQHMGEFHLVTLDEAGVASLTDLNRAQHLTKDRLDVLVVDLHTLQAVHVLNLVDDVLGQGADTQQAQDVMRVARTIGDHFTLVHLLAFDDVQVAPLRNQLFVRLAAIGRRNHLTTLALGFLTERDGAADLRQDRRLFRTARFEQVGNTRQTTGDVAGLGSLLRDTRDNVTHIDLGTVGNTHQGVGRQEVLSRHVGTWQQQFLAIGIDHLDRRANILAGSPTVLRIHHFNAGQTGQFVGLTLDGDVFFHANEGNDALHFGHDRVGVRIPLGHDSAGVDLVAFLDGNHRTVRQLVTLTLTTEVIRNRQLTGTRNGYQCTV